MLSYLFLLIEIGDGFRQVIASILLIKEMAGNPAIF